MPTPRQAVLFLLVPLALASTPLWGAVLGSPVVASPADRLFADGTFVVTEPLVVNAGTTLTVRNATLVLDHRCSAPCSSPEILVDGGRLVLDGAVLTTSLADDGFEVVGRAGQLVAWESLVERFRVVAFEGALMEPSRLDATTFRDGVGPVSFTRGANVDVHASRFEGLRHGLVLRDASGIVSANAFVRIEQRAADLQASALGERAIDATFSFQDNTLQDVGQGIVYLDDERNRIVRNTVVRATHGAVFALFADEDGPTGGPVFEENAFLDVDVGLAVTIAGPSTATAVLVARDNRFESVCTAVDAMPRPGLVVDATLNWWGTPEGPLDAPGCPAYRGVVLVAPWLTE